MYAESDTELRSLIVQSLESSGFLNKIKAELRAGVFLAFEEEGSLRKKIPLFNKNFDDFVETSNGKIILSLVREFLEFFNLNFTLSVFDPEVANDSPCLSRTELCTKLNLKNSDIDGPIISALLKSKLVPETGKQSINQNSGSHVSYVSASITKSLETISEDFPVKEKSLNETFLMKDDSDVSLSSAFTLKETTENDKSRKKSSSLEPSVTTPNISKNHTPMIESLKNEFGRLDSKEETKISDIFGNDKPGASEILKEIMSSSKLDHDPFFDEPLPSEKQNIFNLPKEKGSNSSKKEESQNEGSTNLFGTEKSTTLTSLKDLPSLTSNKSKDWKLSRELPKTLPSLDSGKPLPLSSMSTDEKTNLNDASNKNQDPESNEESSDKQMNSEESIEEELEEDFSGGLEDLLNSSLSLGDDATSDQSVSQVSVVDGVDHIEPCNTVK